MTLAHAILATLAAIAFGGVYGLSPALTQAPMADATAHAQCAASHGVYEPATNTCDLGEIK